MDLPTTVPLPRTAEAVSSGALDTIEECLLEDLEPHVYALVTDVTVEGVEEEELVSVSPQMTDHGLRALITLSWTSVRPSGCSDSPHRTPLTCSRKLYLNTGEDEATIDFDPGSPDQLDLLDQADRNSAADGR